MRHAALDMKHRMLALHLLWTALVFQCCLANNCGPGVVTPGVIIPKDDIMIEYGNPLEIFCVLNSSHPLASNKSSKHLVFYHNDKPALPQFVQVLNSTTIRLHVEKPPPSRSMYRCNLQADETNGLPEQAVCLRIVEIAFKPQEVINFTCVSHNWDNLTCSWTEPENYVKTNYTLRYRLDLTRVGRNIFYGCPSTAEVEKNRCFWDHGTNPHYRQPYENYFFNMTGVNALGNVSFQTKFHHYGGVIPSPPTKLSFANETSSSVCLKWEVPFPLQNFPPGLVHKVRYQSVWDSRDFWEEVNMGHITKNKTLVMEVTGLKYANSLYEMKVYMKSAVAEVGNGMWSIPANITIRTLPTVPGASPKIDVGSFEVTAGLTSRDIYIYWQHIPEYLKNGEQFEYRVYKIDERGVEHLIKPSESSKAYAKLKEMSLGGHRLKVVAANQVGRSHDQPEIYVPGQMESPPEPISFNKIAYGERMYELSWKPPQSHHNIVNYTIFWCDNERDRPYQCTGFLNWTHVSKDVVVTKIDVPEDKIYQFAISANTKDGSSGMVWASCTVIHDKVVGRMKNVWINQVGSRFIEVGWKLDCSDGVGMVTGFRISYCPIIGPQKMNCTEPTLNRTIPGDPTTVRGEINGLKPYKTYMVRVAVVTKNGGGSWSVALLNTTLEDAPDSPPANVTITQVTNTSMVVAWRPPIHENGLVRHYFVNYNDKRLKVDRYKTVFKLTNLTSYTNYSISIEACTVACSERSPDIVICTGVGIPGEVDRPKVEFTNTSEVFVSWGPPSLAAGELNLYQLMVQQRTSDTNISTAYYNSTEFTAQIPVLDCKGKGHRLTYAFAVRAINIGPDNSSYLGPWSQMGESNCFNSANFRNVVVVWIFGVVALIALCVVLGYVGKRAWIRCKVMQDVEVKLPAGLASLGEKDNHIHVHSWPTNDDRDAHKTRSSADEELLLRNKCSDGDGTQDGSGGDDSSGCSSGHDSVSSPLTDGTHMSSDSGTEVDQRAASPDGAFPECFSLRHGEPYVRLGKLGSGSVARSTPNLNELDAEGGGTSSGLAGNGWSSTGYISMQGSNEDMETAQSGYCRVGMDPLPAKGYVSIATMPTPSSGYVAHSAYVPNASPLLSPEPYCRMGVTSPGYVPLEGVQSGGYVPHGKFDKQENLYTSVFAPVTSDTHIVLPTTSV